MDYKADFFIEKLLNYYNISTISELAVLLNTKQTSISSWRSRNSVNAIKKKCRELGIYNDIFGDANSQIIKANHGQVAQNVSGAQNFNANKEDNNIDIATYNLFKEAYDKAIDEDDLKRFRLYLMEY
ncbi:MAG: hypothetical protein Q7S59_10315 [Sulfurimonas sp.]|nr:hypothetical protein [Sulfurimonas sp.]